MSELKNFFRQYSHGLTPIERVRMILFSTFGFILLLVSLLFIGISTNKPYIGADLTLKDNVWTVQFVDPPGLANQAGIQVGDRPIEINSQPAAVFLKIYEKTGIVWSPVIEELSVINNQGQVKSVTIQGNSQTSQSATELAMRFLACLIFWSIGLYVFIKKPLNPAARLFYLCCFVISLVLSANMAFVRGVQTAVFLEVGASVIGPWLLLHFFLVLPDERTSVRNQPLIYLIYVPALLTLVLFPMIGFADGQPVPWFRSLRLFEYGVGFVAVLVVACWNYFSSRSFRTHQQMKIVLISCLTALVPLIIINLLPQAIWGNQNVFQAGFSILLIVFIPIGMGYAIVNQQLLDIDLVIRRGVIYGLITIVMAGILAAAIFVVLAAGKTVGIGEEILLALALGGLATALFGPSKAGIELLVDKFLYRDRYDYRQIIQSLSSSLNSFRELTEVSRLIVGTTVGALNLAGGSLLVKTQHGNFETGATQGIFNQTGHQQKLIQIISQRNSKCEFPNPALGADPNVAFLIPLLAGQQEVGLLCLSPKNTRQKFSHDDLFLLQGLATVSAMAVRNALLVRDVSMRDTFVSIASHELRTPLTSIVGYADLLLQRNPPEDKRKLWLKNILDSGYKLTAMVDDLLNVSRIQSGRVTLKIEKMELPGLLKERMAIAREMSVTHEIILDIQPKLPDVLADRDKLGQVIGNLLSNAIKYSPRGGKVILSAQHEPHKDRVVISITDQGIGIGPKDRDLLFTTFHRIQRPETQGIRGSGLGLYISKEWAVAMGGAIWLESQLNQGSTFFVAVPTWKTASQSEKLPQ